MQRGNSMFYVHASMSTSRNGMLQLILISNRDCEMTAFFLLNIKANTYDPLILYMRVWMTMFALLKSMYI